MMSIRAAAASVCAVTRLGNVNVQLGRSRHKRACRFLVIGTFFTLAAVAVPACAGGEAVADELDRFTDVGPARLATVTAGRGSSDGAGSSPRPHDQTSRTVPSIAPVWNATEHWKLALDSRIFVDPERAARAVLGLGELGAGYSPFKDLDLAIGFMRNPKDGALNAMVFTMGMSARY